MTIAYGNADVGSGDDVQRVAFDWPAGMIGDPNAIPSASRCDIDYTGGSPGPNTNGYNYCQTNFPQSRIGDITVVGAAEALGFVGCGLNLTGGLYLLRNRPTATPEVPVYVGVHVSGTPTGFGCGIAGNQRMNMTAQITLRPDDNGLRLVILDTIPRTHNTNSIAGTADIRVDSISQTIYGMAANGAGTADDRPFLTMPTRCTNFTTTAYVRGYDAPTNYTSDRFPIDGTNDSRSGPGTQTPNCGAGQVPGLNLGFAMSTTTTEAGAPVGVRATVTNTVPTANVGQGAYAKSFQMVLPLGYKINPGVATRLGANGCQPDEFFRPGPGQAVTNSAPTCPTSSQVGTVAVDAPQFTDDLTGRLYLGQPLTGDEAAGIYRLYVYAARGATATKFQGTATANPTTGRVTVMFDNAGLGLPQFNYREFILDFDTASAGVGTPSSGAISNPNSAQQMLMNPQVCTTQADFEVTITPWTDGTQAAYTTDPAVLANGTRRTITETGDPSCAFTAFNPSFNANVSDTGAGKHPNLELTVTRPDRQDNLRDMVFDLPTGFGGAVTAIPTADRCTGTKAEIETNGCPAASAIGTVEVITGTGASPATLTGTIYMAVPDPGDTARLAIITPAQVGPFNLGRVVNITKMTIPSTSTFRLRASTLSLEQSIKGVPILYKQIKLTLNGIVAGRPFLQNPSACPQLLNFNATITSNGDLSGNTPGSGSVSTTTPADSTPQSTTGCGSQTFNPTFTATPTVTETAKPTGLTVVASVPQTTTGATGAMVQQSTIKRFEMTFPAGMDFNPRFAQDVSACPQATVTSDKTAGTSNCPVGSKIGDVTVVTPLLPNNVTGGVYLVAPGTPVDDATRYRFALYLSMPGGMQIVDGSAQVDGDSDLVNGLGSKDTGTGQITADFDNLPDVAYSSMTLAFNTTTPMLVNPDTCATHSFGATITPTNGTAANRTSNYATNYPGACPPADPWAPVFSLPTLSTTVANAHPDLSLTVTRPDKNQYLQTVRFGLPVGLTGAPTATNTVCAQATADLANCTAASQIGTVAVEIGSGATVASLSTGTLHNTVAPANRPAKLTAQVPVVLGPFDFGKMSLPIDVQMRSDYGLDATVSLPQRYEGIKVRYRSLNVTINGTATQGTPATGDDKPFLTNPSKCGTNSFSTTMTSTSATAATDNTRSYSTTGCGSGANFGTNPTLVVSGVNTATQAPTGMNVAITSAATNPSIKQIRMTLPSGMSLNPAVGLNGANTTCPTATINAGGSGCPAASIQGTVTMQTALLSGTFNGTVYLEAPGTTAATRYRLAMVIALPGQNLIVRGGADVAGDTDVTAGGTGSIDTSGQVVVDFDNIPDLPFTNLNLTLASGDRAMLRTPSTCATHQVVTTIAANSAPSNAITVAPVPSFATSTNCTSAFTPTFDASLSTLVAGGNPTLGISVTNGGSNVNYLRDLNLRLPTGLVANTTAVAYCSQANAAAGTCGSTTPLSAVGSVTTSIGSSTAAQQYTLNGTIYNVTPNSTEPARLQAIIPVNVGPFALGNLTIPITTALDAGSADYTPDVAGTQLNKFGVNTFTQLPTSYEGIDVRVRSLGLTINGTVGGQPFMINPSQCGAKRIAASMIAPDPITVNASEEFTFTGCNRAYSPAPTLAVTPSTQAAAAPTGLRFDLGSAITAASTSSVNLQFPTGIEINPAGGAALAACSTANIDAGGASCPAASKVADVTLTTPLLSTPRTGEVFIETPGTLATDRYKLGLVVHLPGADLVLHGTMLLNGSTSGASGAVGSTDSGTGQITATFPGIPDLGFSNMRVNFNGATPLFVNQDTCVAAGANTFTATFTPHGTGATSAPTAGYATNTNCTVNSTFAPTFSGNVTTTNSAANPNLTFAFTRPDLNRDLRDISVGLPTGLVAATTATPRCSQANAAAGTCLATQEVGTVTAQIGSGSTLSLPGTVYNVAPNSNEPARLSAKVPVTVGPFNLGSLNVPIATSLRADFGVDATATLPLRYEGIAVHTRNLSVTLNGQVGGNDFVINPSRCGTNTVNGSMTSEGPTPSTVVGSWNFTTGNCGTFGSAPTLTVTPSTNNAGAPVGLEFEIDSSANNPTINRVLINFPVGMEVNPAFANGLVACSTANINAGTCNTADAIATVNMTTHLLGANPTGHVYLETPGATATDRYRVAMIVDLPGRKLVVRGEIGINGSTTIPSGGTGSVDSGNGQITADFKNIPDLGFTELRMAFDSGPQAFAVNPDTCTSHGFSGQVFPNSGGAAANVNSTITTNTCSTDFDPAFSTTFSPAAPAAASHPDMTFNVSRPDQHKSLRNLTISLPTGLVANTSAVATNCSQASALAGTCETTAAGSQVGSFNTSFGSGVDSYSLTGGKLFQVVPNSNEPARFAAIIPVNVGPFDLGRMTIPVTTTLRADYGLDAAATLPNRYEGIAVRIRTLAMTLNGTVNSQPYVTMPSKCEAKTVSATMTAADSTADTSAANNSSSFTPGGCSALTSAYNPSVTASVSPTTAGHPTAFSFGVNVPANSSSTGRVQVQMPQGMELSPGVGNGLVACSTANIDAGGSACQLTSANLGTVTVNTPLLPTPQTGNVFLETPGLTAGDRYKLAIVLHLPGRDMVIHGGALVDGSTNVAGGLGSTDSAGTATGRVTADFPGIPDLGFTSMAIAFNSSGNKLFVNPKTAATHTVNATITPNSGVASATPTATFTTSGGTSSVTDFNPGFTGSITPTTSAGNPNLSMTITNPTGMQEVKSFAINLPQGLVARTTSVPRCSQNDATTGNCLAANRVGSVVTTIGSGSETYAVTGDIFNVTPDSNQPARLQAVVPVVVGPFNLGKLSIPVPTQLNSDLTVTASATLPSRFEGIAVRTRSLQMTVEGNPNGNKFMVAPTRCGSSNLAAAITSDTGNVANVTAPITVTGCPTNFAASPAFAVTRSTSVRNTPVNLGFTLTSNADNPTIGRVLVEMPNGMEINPAFGDGLEACPTAAINAGGDTCPAAAQLGIVSLKTQLLDPATSYTGKVFLEEVGNTAVTRYKLALVVELPGADLVVRGKVTVVGSTDITGGTGSVSDPDGYGKIFADFDTIPDLGFTEMNISFNTATPMLVNPSTCAVQTFTASITPSSNGATASPTAGYTTTPAGCFDSFAPTFSAVPSDTTAGGHPDLTLNVARPNDNHRPIKNFNLQLPVGLVASTVATTQCPQATAMAGNCPGSTRVGDFTTQIGQFSGAGTGLDLAGQIFNVVPDSNEPARLVAQVNVVVGPFDLGKLVIPITTQLRSDLGINTFTQLPTRYEGIAVRIKNMQILLYGYAQNGNPFLQYPSKCTPATRTITANMTSDLGDISNRNSTIGVTGCPQDFAETPTVDVSTNPSETTVPTSLGVTIGSSPENSTISRIQVALPEGMSVNAAVGNGLTTCSTAQLNSDHLACPVASRQGTVVLSTPLLAGTYNGYVYLEDPQGTSHTTRYRLAVVVDLPGAQMVVRGKVLIDGSSTIPTGGTGAVDSGTGRITTDFDNVPDLSFSQLQINFNTGPRALLTNPDECGTHTVQSTITPSAGGADAVINSDFDVSYDGSGGACPGTQPFAPSFSATAASTTSGGNTDLEMKVTAGAKNQALRELNFHLPAGLVADTDAVPQCSQANAAAGNCLPANQVGSVTTKLGTGSETLDITGSIYNVVPNSDEPARLQAVLPVVVGPYNLGKLSLPVSTQLRSGDYGVDATTDIPTRYEGIAVRIAELEMDLLGTVGGNGFIKNPSKCGTGTIAADMVGSGGNSVTGTAPYPVDGCPRDFVSSPTITVSGTNSETAVSTGMTLDIHSADDNPTILSVETTMPDGMTLNPAVGNSLDACSTAAIDAGGASCPADSQIGTVEMVTPLLSGTHTGKVFLETPGNTAADRYKLAIVVDLPGTQVIVRGTAAVDGSSDLTNGAGSVDTGTGRVVASFPALPDLNFSDLKIAFAGGPDALFTNAETCGTQTVDAVFTPQSSSNTASSSDDYTTSYDGAGAACPGSESFSPNFSGSVSTTQAAGNPDLTINVSRSDKTQQLREFDLHLPTGLVADTVQTPRCPQLDAAAGNCDASTVVGSVSTEIGTGSETLAMSGNLHNVVPDSDEPARLAAVIDVVVGPYDLGKLSIPVTTEIVTGALPSDLTIDTQTTIPSRYEGVAVRIRTMQIVINGVASQGTPSTADDKPFMINPSRCGLKTVTADMESPSGASATGSFNFTTTGCPAAFNPSIATTVTTTESGVPSGYNLAINVPGNSSSIRKVSTVLPEGMEINPGVANTGGANGLEACDVTDVETETGAGGATACPNNSIVGAVTLETPLLPGVRDGKVYLVTPGNTPSTRYKLALAIDLPGPDLVVHGQAQVNGSGSGANSGTGQVSAVFDNLPDLQFSKLEVQFASGDHALLTNPRSCQAQQTDATLTPWSVTSELDPDADAVSRSASFTTSYDGSGAACPGTEPFDPSFSASVSNSDQAASPDLELIVNGGSKDARLTDMTIGLPVGLVANTTAAPQCSQVDAAAGTCAAASQVGAITTEIGAGGDPLAIDGEIYNVAPDADQPAKLSAKIDVVVGPYNLGTLTIPVDTAIRAGNDADANRRYGIDATTSVPTRFEGVAIQMRSLDMTLFGDVGGNEFIVNPSKCGSHTVTAELEGDGGQTSTETDDITIGNCQSGFNVAPAITASVTPSETAVPSDLTIGITSSNQNQTIESVATELPEGMTINPAIGNSFGTDLSTCPSASLDAGDVSGCADAQIGTVTLTTPLLPGTQNGKVYLETPGSGAANRYRMAIVVDLPGQKLVVRGKVNVDGSTDLVDGMGSTANSTGQMTATFDPIPDLGFTAMTVAFDTGSRSLLTNPETCGAQTVTATIMPTSGSVAATPTAAFNTSYDGAGAGCPASEPFNPTFDASFSTLQAAGNPDMTLTITRSDKTEQLREFDLALPPGLVANTVDTLRCPQADALTADCTEESRVGDVSTKIGTGSETLDMTGGIYNVVPDNDEPARLAAIMDVVVGPYDLGKLSIPVTTEIVSGATAADLAIETHTTIPQRYEGMPVRVREMQITLHGLAKQGTPSTSDDKPFMILPSKCATSTITANMESSEGTSVAVGDNFTTVDCANAPYNPSLNVDLKPGNDAGKPVGLDLGFQFDGASSSTKKIRTLLPVGMGINPGIGNYNGANMTCDPADVDAGGSACPAESKLGDVKLDTPLLPNQQTGAIYLEDPGTGAAERYKLGVYVDLPGSGDLVLHGRATVSGSSDVTNGMGSVDSGDGQVVAEFDDLPDLQFSSLLIEFKTTGASDHALLTNPEVCGDHTVTAEMSPWSRPTDIEAATDTISIDDCTAEGPMGLSASVSSLGVGEHADVSLTLSRPDGNKSIKRATFELPKGLVGSADAAPTCEDDADSAQAGLCPASTKVGEVALQIGSSDDPYAITGDIFNTEAPSNRPAKLTFAAHVEVGPFDFGRIAVPIDVNIDSNEYFLWAETGDMPQRFEGIPVRISEMQVDLFGMADQGTPSTADDKPFMSNPRTCTTALDLTAEVVAPDSSTTDLTSQIGPFTGCENLNLDDNSIEISNYNDAAYNDKPERPTKLGVKVTQGTGTDQAALKDLSVDLPGFRLSAAAANGLSACSATQLNNQNCPAASRVGTVWLDTPLLPKNAYQDPDNPSGDQHSLWGAVYLETPGTASDGSDRYKLAIQLTGKTLITIRGTAVVNETTGEIVTEFNDLPDIPFEQMYVDLTGAEGSTPGTFKPLLLNPENPNTASGITVAAGASMNSWSAPATVVNRSSTSPVTVEAGTTKTFAPNTTSSISPMTSGAHPDAVFTYSRNDGEEDIKNVKMGLPAGFLGSAAAVPQCSLAAAAAGNCSAASEVGTVVVNIGQYGQYLPMSGHVYLTEGSNGDIAGMSIKVPAEAGPYDLGDYITQGRVLIRPSDHGIDVDFRDVPKMFKGVPTHISNMEITLPGKTSTNKPFLYNASNCAPQNITSTITPWSGTVASQNIPYQATNCPSRAFTPSMSFTASGGNGPYDAPAWAIKMGTNEGDSTLKGVTVLLPTIMTVNVQGLASQCQPDVAAARSCGPESQIGSVSIKTPLLTAPVEGKVFMAKSITGSSLPDLLIEIPAPIDMQIRGANSFVNSIQIKSDFQNLPDLVWSEMTMSIGGGPKGLITTRENGTCGAAQTSFASHSGQGISGTSPVIGLADCVNPGAKCEAPTVNFSAKGVRKKGNKKSSTATTFGIPVSCAPIKSFQILYPKGSKVNKKQLKWVAKKKLNKTQKKANKKNQSNVTGKAGSKALKVFDFQAVGRNGLKIKSLPANTRSITLNTKNSTMLLPYKTFCGALKKGKTAKSKKAYAKALKKCQAKNITVTFVYTLEDGKVVRYNHTMKAGDKKLK